MTGPVQMSLVKVTKSIPHGSGDDNPGSRSLRASTHLISLIPIPMGESPMARMQNVHEKESNFAQDVA